MINEDIINECESSLRSYKDALHVRQSWDGLWQDCYDMALPQRHISTVTGVAPSRKGERLFDGTALDAVDQLAASIMGHLTPNFTPWVGVKAGTECTEDEKKSLVPLLEQTSKMISTQLARSNFIVEFHQTILDVIVAGTGCLAVEEEKIGSYTAFRFTAIPLQDVVMNEGHDGRLTETYRVLSLTKTGIEQRYQIDELLSYAPHIKTKDMHTEYEVLEIVKPEGTGFVLLAMMIEDDICKAPLARRKMSYSPYINFRWMKSPSEIYGRSPVMKALPDIKTANKVVELILKNASIAVTGIWQAEDDGVLNTANIQLVPGAIIPKAMGSKGLTPLEMPARFDVSQLVLDDLRSRIRHALLVDRLPQLDGRRMTATEIIERSNEMTLLLGATYGRLQTELLDPLIHRLYDILRKRGEIIDLPLDGRVIEIEYRSPLARAQSTRYAQDIIAFLTDVQALGAEAVQAIDMPKTVRYLADIMGVPSDVVREEFEQTTHNINEGVSV
jgi:hypothetical protein